ncbi:DUF4253 domain-containing protein [Streptomyces rubrogriseus]|uniref:DUF4253 domain-containing protein n=1 Tax=Streptomyces rubrogriseus TaxID=194673 RepID=UPI00142D66E0|nr:DUF4253 domain-containing protein [Streptomyces rubrogriseus]
MTPELLTSLAVPLPAGRLITSDEGGGAVQPLWLSDSPASAELWARLLAEHNTSGLWPLLLDAHDPGDAEFRPWASGELFPERMSAPQAHSPAELLAQWWSAYAETDEDDNLLPPGERLAVTAPFGQAWPGPLVSDDLVTCSEEMAAEYAEVFADQRPQARLGLVAAACGSDALTAAGWGGPVNYHNDTAKFSAVVGDWERRFGVRVVAVGFDSLHLSVAAPPTNTQGALRVAAEHFAFCPDNIWQSSHPYTLAAYAERLVGVNSWDFWWD